MLDRIVPVHRTDLMSLYYAILISGSEEAMQPFGAEAPGVFKKETAGGTTFFAEPVKKATIVTLDTEAVFYFVPAFDFEGFYDIDGNRLNVEVDPDGVTLYKLSFDAGSEVWNPAPAFSLSADLESV